MIEFELQQQLQEALTAYGKVKSVQLLDKGTNENCMILATMSSQEEAMAAQFALGLSSFGFTSLIADADWVRQHLKAR